MTKFLDLRPAVPNGPLALESEQAVLGCVIIEPARFHELGSLQSEHFSEPGHGLIWATISALTAQGKAPEPATLIDRLADTPSIAPLGGRAFILALAEKAPASSLARQFADAVRDAHMRRSGARTLGDAIEALRDSHGAAAPTIFAELRRAVAHLERDAQNGSAALESARSLTAAELQDMAFPPVDWVVDGYIADGLTVLAGKPKTGKSWLALDIALAVARGGLAVGARQCAKGAVLYAALEDTRRRLQDRLRKVQGSSSRERWPANLTLWAFGEMASLDGGGLDQLRAWISGNPTAKLIIIDTFAKVRGPQQGKELAYAADYREVGELKALADETGVAIIVVMHTRKAPADDPFDTVSGTLGITGAADTTLILARDSQGGILTARGRDVAEIETAVEFDKVLFRWTEIGDAATVRRSDERKAILDALLADGGPLTSREIAMETGQRDGAVRRLLSKMAKAGDVRKAGRGKYVHPDHVDDPGNSGNNGNKEEDRP